MIGRLSKFANQMRKWFRSAAAKSQPFGSHSTFSSIRFDSIRFARDIGRTAVFVRAASLTDWRFSMSSMKLARQIACVVVASVVGIGLLATQAQATNRYFDVNGTTTGSGVTAAGSYSWESAFWNNNNASGGAATTAWTEGDFPRFSAGGDTNGKTYTVTASASHTFAGMFGNTNAGGTVHVTTSGGAVLSVTPGLQGLFVGTNTNLYLDTAIGGVDSTSALQWSGGGGSAYLYGANTFQGGVSLNSVNGLNFNNPSSFGTGPISFSTTATAYTIANPDTSAPLTITNSVGTTRSTTSTTFTYAGHDAVTFTKPWTLGATATFTMAIGNSSFPTSKLILSGGMGGAADSNLAVSPSTGVNGTLVLSGSSTYGGTTTIGGTTASTGQPALQAKDGTGLPTASFLNLNGGVLQGDGASSFTRSLATTGASKFQWNTNGGGFSANGGQMTVNVGGAGAELVWGSTVGSQIVGNLDFGSGSANDKTLFQNPIDLNSTATTNVTRTVNVVAGAGGDSAEMSGVIRTTGAATVLAKTGTGTLVLSAANTYSGGTTVSAGTLGIGDNSALGTGALILGGGAVQASGSARTITNNAAITANSSVSGTNPLTMNGTFLNSGGNRVLSSTNTATTTLGGTVYLSESPTTGRTLILAGSATSNPNFVISGNISDFNGSGLPGSIQVGNGSAATVAKLTLTGNNTHTGATNVSTGSLLNIGSANALGASTFTATGNGSFDNTTGGALVLTNNVALSGGSPTFIGTDDLTLGNVAISGAGRTITVNAKTLTVNDITQDVAGRNFTKGVVGTGKLVIKGNASYTGTTTINAGTLQIGNGGTTGTLSTGSAIVDNANLTFNRSNAVTQGTDFSATPITGAAGSLTKEGGGILTLTAANTYGGGTTVNNGKLLANNTTGSATGAGDVTVNANGILGGTGTIAGNVIVNGGQLSPGASINVLNIGGNLSMTGGAFDYEINRDTVGADLNNVTGNLTLTGVALSAADLGVGAVPLAMGTKFTLINYGGTWNGGIFTGLANHSTNLVIGLNRFAIEYADTTGGTNFGGGSVGAGSHFVTITAVPEASAFLTVALGGIFAVAAVWMSKRFGVSVLKA
jgi:autotransporter-associated beta strand protein